MSRMIGDFAKIVSVSHLTIVLNFYVPFLIAIFVAKPISIPLLSFDVFCLCFLPSLLNRAIAIAWIPKFRKSKSDGYQRKDIVLDSD